MRQVSRDPCVVRDRRARARPTGTAPQPLSHASSRPPSRDAHSHPQLRRILSSTMSTEQANARCYWKRRKRKAEEALFELDQQENAKHSRSDNGDSREESGEESDNDEESDNSEESDGPDNSGGEGSDSSQSKRQAQDGNASQDSDGSADGSSEEEEFSAEEESEEREGDSDDDACKSAASSSDSDQQSQEEEGSQESEESQESSESEGSERGLGEVEMHAEGDCFYGNDICAYTRAACPYTIGNDGCCIGHRCTTSACKDPDCPFAKAFKRLGKRSRHIR